MSTHGFEKKVFEEIKDRNLFPKYTIKEDFYLKDGEEYPIFSPYKEEENLIDYPYLLTFECSKKKDIQTRVWKRRCFEYKIPYVVMLERKAGNYQIEWSLPESIMSLFKDDYKEIQQRIEDVLFLIYQKNIQEIGTREKRIITGVNTYNRCISILRCSLIVDQEEIARLVSINVAHILNYYNKKYLTN